MPQGSPRLLLLPGSRSSEVKRNLSLLVGSFVELSDRNRGCAGLIVGQARVQWCRQLLPGGRLAIEQEQAVPADVELQGGLPPGQAKAINGEP